MPQGIKGPEKIIRDGAGNELKREGGWNDQQEMAQYFDFRAGDIAVDLMEKAYGETLLPMFNNLDKALKSLQERVLKIQHPDYDEVSKAVWSEIFTVGPKGEILGVKDPATLAFIQSQPFPFLAAYEHGVKKRAPQKIKEAVTKNTTQVIKDLTTKPKGPTKVGSSGVNPPAAELDWDTPAAQAEQILFKTGIIK
jgi:hypothetical protein